MYIDLNDEEVKFLMQFLGRTMLTHKRAVKDLESRQHRIPFREKLAKGRLQFVLELQEKFNSRVED